MKELQRIILEAVIVLVAGTGVGLLANAVSPKGLSPTRNYFPTRSHADVRTATQPASPANKTISNSDQNGASAGDGASEDATTDTNTVGDAQELTVDPSPDNGFTAQEQETVAYIQAEGLNAISHEGVVEFFNDPNRQFGTVLFVDARNEKQYAEGHIPGAAHMDHYFIENHIDRVLPLAHSSLDVVVYCGGGDCEDSLYAAIELRNRGVDPSKLHVYIGGMKQWKAEGHPVEVGPEQP